MSDKIISKGFINCYFSEYSTYHAAPIKDWSKRIPDSSITMEKRPGMLHKKELLVNVRNLKHIIRSGGVFSASGLPAFTSNFLQNLKLILGDLNEVNIPNA